MLVLIPVDVDNLDSASLDLRYASSTAAPIQTVCVCTGVCVCVCRINPMLITLIPPLLYTQSFQIIVKLIS